MSIATSRDERAQAIARLETLPVAELERDLVHWSIASHASEAQYLLLTEEIVRRRRAARTSS